MSATIDSVRALSLNSPANATNGDAHAAFPIRNICCVGAGYVGGPTAAVIALHNPHINVTVVDRDQTRIRRWNSRHVPIYEPGLHHIVRLARDGSRETFVSRDPSSSSDDAHTATSDDCQTRVAPRQSNLFFTTNVDASISNADIVLISVNTPTKERGVGAGSATDMTAFEAVTAVVARNARQGAIIVEKSTVPCRTAQLVAETIAMYRPGAHFEILSNPEFLAAGTAVNDLLYPDRILIGSAPTLTGRLAAEALVNVYAAWVPRDRILTTNVWSSELAKLVANSMLAQRISSINSISALCEQTGADIDEVSRAVGLDVRIGNKFLVAGIGFGGSCFKKDVLNLVYLADTMGLPGVGEYWRQVVKMNEYARDRFTNRVIKCLNNTLVGKKICILGYAFKKNTSDTREAPALEMIKTLLEERPREIAVFDPCCNPLVIKNEIRCLVGPLADDDDDDDNDNDDDNDDDNDGIQSNNNVSVYTNAYDACDDATAVIIATEFDEFRNQPLLPNKSTTTVGAGAGAGVDATTSSTTRAAAAEIKGNPDSDPRPFGTAMASEKELLALHKHLVAQRHAQMSLDDDDDDDPLKRFKAEPLCDDDCPDCQQEYENSKISGQAAATGIKCAKDYKPNLCLDWEQIADSMAIPRWVFDGRGVIDSREMVKLGVKVESVGRQHRF